MKCTHCRRKFPANIEATWPGGFDSPGVFFYFGMLLFIAATILYLLSIEMRWWIVLPSADSRGLLCLIRGCFVPHVGVLNVTA
jgi:hypothetical protein